jgi:lycopene beta-cyclase
MIEADVLIAGGGLSGGLLALGLAKQRPDLRVMLVEPQRRLGGNHIWSFFDSDVASSMRWLVDPLVSRRWTGNDVRFPAYARTLAGTYNSIESERLDAEVRTTLPSATIVEGRIATLETGGATLADGRRVSARAVIDARNMVGEGTLRFGWQKFVGQMLRLTSPHGLTRPVIMDATVDQSDGYRFVYLLPFDAERVFVEDTYYTVGPELDRDALRSRIATYAHSQGWTVAEIEREEAAALPIAMGGNFDAFWPADDAIPRIGMAAGLFQPLTGYSLPDAVRTVALILALPRYDSATLAAALRVHSTQAWQSRRFYRLLVRMLFLAADPADRYRLLQRFYRLDEGLIGRFYAAQSTALDKMRVLVGKPPVPLHRALVAATARS